MFNSDLIQILPILFLLASGLVLMVLDAFKMEKLLPLVATIGLLGAIILAIPFSPEHMQESLAFGWTTEGFSRPGMIWTGGLASLVIIFLAGSGLFTLFFLQDFLKRNNREISDVYALLIFTVIGTILLANSNDLIMLFIGLETMSICLYIMAALFKTDLKSNEAGLKYFLLGAFASGFLLFGISFIYGGSGSTNYSMMDFQSLQSSGLMLPGMGLLLIGFLFKLSAFPFHAWTPDVYVGTPTPFAGYMATGSKAASVIALGVFMHKSFPNLASTEKLTNVLLLCALLTMIYGNIVAAQQTNLKRMFAYSSIAHSGYVLLGLAAFGTGGLKNAIFYMFIYTLMNIGAFGMLGMVENKHSDVESESWKGLAKKHPWFAVGMSIFLFSLAGIPPFAGFMAKYFVFLSAIQSKFFIVAILGILTSVVGAYYYIRVIVLMFFGEESSENEIEPSKDLLPRIGIVILLVLLVVLGVFPSLITQFLDTMAADQGMFTQPLP